MLAFTRSASAKFAPVELSEKFTRLLKGITDDRRAGAQVDGPRDRRNGPLIFTVSSRKRPFFPLFSPVCRRLLAPLSRCENNGGSRLYVSWIRYMTLVHAAADSPTSTRESEQQIDTAVDVVTPENIAFSYHLAGPFRRLLAFGLDQTLKVLVAVGLYIVLGITGIVVGPTFVPLYILAMFVVHQAYGGLFETFWNGQTPGKYLLHIRVLTTAGEPINGMQAMLRNFLRELDLLLLTGLIACSMNRRNQRLGDLVADTMVVVEETRWLTGVARLEDERAGQLAAYIPSNFVVSRSLARAVAHYVDRRKFLSQPRRREIAQHVAVPLIERFSLPPDTSYDLLLCALYYRTFIADRAENVPTLDPYLRQKAQPLPQFNPQDVFAAPTGRR